jgi:hypothetical protein
MTGMPPSQTLTLELVMDAVSYRLTINGMLSPFTSGVSLTLPVTYLTRHHTEYLLDN